MLAFAKRYLMSVLALIIALIVLFWLLNLVKTKVPGAVGATAGTVADLANGSRYGRAA